jgi:hypothetical protein
VGATLALGAAVRAAPPTPTAEDKCRDPNPLGTKRVFIHDGDGWYEVSWRDMRPGDRVLCLDLWDGHLVVEGWLIGRDGVGTETLDDGTTADNVEIAEVYNVLPVLWGNPDPERVLRREVPSPVNGDTAAARMTPGPGRDG